LSILLLLGIGPAPSPHVLADVDTWVLATQMLTTAGERGNHCANASPT